jgi:cytochrome c nitrite reductase small subunit
MGSVPNRIFGMSLAGLCLSAAVGVPIGLATYTFDYAEGTSYLSNDPAACVNCHIMREQFDGWQKGSHHAAATCNDCHVPQELLGKYFTKMEHGYRHSKGFTFQDFHEPIQITKGSADIVEANCVRCHQTFVEEIIAHNVEGVGCIHCHTGVGHGPVR